MRKRQHYVAYLIALYIIFNFSLQKVSAQEEEKKENSDDKKEKMPGSEEDKDA